MRARIKAVLRAERDAVLGRVPGASGAEALVMAVGLVLEERRGIWRALLKNIYLSIGDDFAASVLARLKEAAITVEVKADGKDDPLPVVPNTAAQAVILQYLQARAGRKITEINATTLRQVRRTLAEGVAAGEGITDLTKRIDRLYLEQIIPFRSEVIARTEVLTASSVGSRAGALETGLPLEKEWLATKDDRVRPEHLATDGQRQPLNEPYTVAGERLMFPRDDSLGASADNIIQCRCSEVYHVVRRGR